MASTFDRSPVLAAAHIIGIGCPTFMAGYQVALSQLAIPPLLDKPQSISTRVFAHVYRQGALVAVPLSVMGTLASLLAAVLSRPYPSTPYSHAFVGQRTAWCLAGLSCVSIPAFTALVMADDIKPLLERADAFALDSRRAEGLVTPADDVRVRGWLESWARLNFVRSSIMGGAALVAAYAIVTRP